MAERVIIRVDRAKRSLGRYDIWFMDSGPDCNPGRLMVYSECSGHGEGIYPRGTAGTRPATESEAAKALKDYCSRYSNLSGEYAAPDQYRVIQRDPRRG